MILTCIIGPAVAQEAARVEVGREFGVVIDEVHERHHYTIRSPGNGVLKLELAKPLEQHKGIHPWWGEVADENGHLREIRPGIWDIRSNEGEEIRLSVRSNLHDFYEVAHAEEIRLRVVFTPEHSAGEPNDTAQTATAIKHGEEFSFQINPRFDRDYFKLTSPGNGVLKLEWLDELSEHKSLHPWWGEVADENGQLREHRPGIFDIRAREGEDVTLGIRSNLYDFYEVAHAEIIRAQVVFTPEHSTGEPNDTPQTATTIKHGEEFTFQINPRFDRDYFKLTSPGNGVLKLELLDELSEHKSLHPWWGEVADENGHPREHRPGIWDIRAREGEEVTLGIRSNLHDFYEVAHAEIIRARVVFTPEHSAGEPNDSPQTATAIQIGEAFSFQINPRFDRDYFKLKSPGDGTLRLDLLDPLTQHAGVHPWWGETADENGHLSEVRPGQWDIRATKGQEITLGIRSNLYDFYEVSHPEIIRAKVSFIESEDGEPNDTPELARNTALDAPFNVILMPRHDRDCHRFEAPDDGVIVLERIDEQPIHPRLHPAWIQQETTREGSWDTRVRKGETPILMLRSSQYDFYETASPAPVTLRATFLAEADPVEVGDLPQHASEVRIGEPFDFAIMPSWDRDHFRFTAAADGYVAFKLQADGVGFPMEIGWISDEAGAAPVMAASTAIVAGRTYHLVVASQWGASRSPGVLRGLIHTVDAPPTPTRRWTFPIHRPPPEE